MDDVARYDWPAVVAEVQRRTGKRRVTVLAHCLSSPCFMLSIIRGHLSAEAIGGFVASQVGVDLVMTNMGMLKLDTQMEKLLPPDGMVHEIPAQVTDEPSDLAISLLAQIVPKSYSCDNPACYRLSATFGDLTLHERLNPETHAIIGDLVPQVVTAFLQDTARHARNESVLRAEDMPHLGRLAFPIHFISGAENQVLLPEGTRRTWQMLNDTTESGHYERTVFEGFGHLDCFIGDGADGAIWPSLVPTLS